MTNAKFIKNLARFRLITFDVTGTLVVPRNLASSTYIAAAKEFGISGLDPSKVNKAFYENFKYMEKTFPNFGYTTPGMTWHSWWKDLVKQVFLSVDPKVPIDKLDILAEKLIKDFESADKWQVIEDCTELLDKLHSSEKCLGVISNFDPRLEHLLSELGLSHYFNFIITSYNIGIHKPHKEIFEKALEISRVEPCEALHVGDKYVNDYLGAREAGWSALLVQKDGKNHSNVPENHAHCTMKDVINALQTKNIDW